VAGLTTTNALAPPSTLGKAGSDLWNAIMSEYEIADSGGREMLQQGCAAADRLAKYAEIIGRDGPVRLNAHALADRGSRG
jgi:hypothetical protein